MQLRGPARTEHGHRIVSSSADARGGALSLLTSTHGRPREMEAQEAHRSVPPQSHPPPQPVLLFLRDIIPNPRLDMKLFVLSHSGCAPAASAALRWSLLFPISSRSVLEPWSTSDSTLACLRRDRRGVGQAARRE
jgi:hypothetical protein